MGTNYYAKYGLCKHCGRYNKVHFGKSSAGWKFMFRANPKLYEDFKSFCKFIERKDVEISDEYGRIKSATFLIDLVQSKQKDKSHIQSYPSPDKQANIMDYEFFDYEFS